MSQRILIMGLPGSGKTTLADRLRGLLDTIGLKTIRLNADAIREEYNDWDFSYEGRIRQGRRMRDLADKIECDYAVCDFVAPTEEIRSIFNADITIWMDTINEGRYEDTNKVFVPPLKYDFRVTEQDSEGWCSKILPYLLK